MINPPKNFHYQYMKPEDFPKDHEWSPKDCRKESPDCYCRTGWPYEKLHIECRDKRYPGDYDSFCICG